MTARLQQIIIFIPKPELEHYPVSEHKIEISEIILFHVGDNCPITKGKLIHQKINRLIYSGRVYVILFHHSESLNEPFLVW